MDQRLVLIGSVSELLRHTLDDSNVVLDDWVKYVEPLMSTLLNYAVKGCDNTETCESDLNEILSEVLAKLNIDEDHADRVYDRALYLVRRSVDEDETIDFDTHYILHKGKAFTLTFLEEDYLEDNEI